METNPTYTNEALENLLRRLTDSTRWEWRHQLCTLYFCHRKTIAILQTIRAHLPAIAVNDKLNYYYTLLSLYIGKLLKEGELSELASLAPPVFKNVIDSHVPYDDWLRAYQKIRNFDVEIERTYIYAERPRFEEHEKLQKLLNESIDPLLEDYRGAIKYFLKSQLNTNEPNVAVISLPPKSTWEQLTLRFLNEQEVIVLANNHTVVQTTCAAMGFAGYKKQTEFPNKQWKLLRVFGLYEGRLPSDIMESLGAQARNAIQQQRRRLEKGLTTCFSELKGSPFYEPKEHNAYYTLKIKVELEPDIPAEDRERELREFFGKYIPATANLG